jgi:hypothetical protein
MIEIPKKIFKIVLINSFVFALTINLTFAANSTNYYVDANGNNAGNYVQNTSNNFSVGCSEFGKIGEGIIASAGYSVSHNLPCEIPLVNLDFRFAPEKRVPVPNVNLDMKDMQVSVRAVGSAAFTQPIALSNVVSDTDVNGYNINPATLNILPGVYDVFIKSAAHLNQKYGVLTFNGATSSIDFSQSLTKFAKAGDINGAQFGDDEVNALDISIMIQSLNTATYRPDVNQDGRVNALDVGILIANLNQIGE